MTITESLALSTAVMCRAKVLDLRALRSHMDLLSAHFANTPTADPAFKALVSGMTVCFAQMEDYSGLSKRRQ